MTISPTRRLLPLSPTTRHGSRSHLTCLYRCGNACDQPVPNPTDHPTFHEVAAQALARRSLLKIGAGASALTVTGRAAGGTLAAAAVAGNTAGEWRSSLSALMRLVLAGGSRSTGGSTRTGRRISPPACLVIGNRQSDQVLAM